MLSNIFLSEFTSVVFPDPSMPLYVFPRSITQCPPVITAPGLAMNAGDGKSWSGFIGGSLIGILSGIIIYYIVIVLRIPYPDYGKI